MGNNQAKTFGGIVLFGGQSTRMGRPKHLLRFGPQMMLERIVEILGEVVSPIVVVGARGQTLPSLPDEVILACDEKEQLGPLEGLAVGLSVLRGRVDAAYASSCDVPLLTPSFVRRMIHELGDCDLAIPRDGKYHHPLAAVYRVELEDKVRSLIAAGRMRPLFLVEECNANVVDVDELRSSDADLDSLRNTNTREDYRAALEKAGLPAEELDGGANGDKQPGC